MKLSFLSRSGASSVFRDASGSARKALGRVPVWVRRQWSNVPWNLEVPSVRSCFGARVLQLPLDWLKVGTKYIAVVIHTPWDEATRTHERRRRSFASDAVAIHTQETKPY